MRFILLMLGLRESYTLFHSVAKNTYKDRVAALDKATALDWSGYIQDAVPLFAAGPNNTIKYVTMAFIEKDIADACARGRGFVEYKIHTHLYPGYKGDNISFLTGKYYIYDTESRTHLEIPGAPNYVTALRGKLPGLIVTFREGTHNNGYLRVELP